MVSTVFSKFGLLGRQFRDLQVKRWSIFRGVNCVKWRKANFVEKMLAKTMQILYSCCVRFAQQEWKKND